MKYRPHFRRDLYAILCCPQRGTGADLCNLDDARHCQRHSDVLLSIDRGPRKPRDRFPHGPFAEEIIQRLEDYHIDPPPDAEDVLALFLANEGPRTSLPAAENLNAIKVARRLYWAYCGSKRILMALDQIEKAIKNGDAGEVERGVDSLRRLAWRVLWCRPVALRAPPPDYIEGLPTSLKTQLRLALADWRRRPRKERLGDSIYTLDSGARNAVDILAIEELDLLNKLRALADNFTLPEKDRRIALAASKLLEGTDEGEERSIRGAAKKAGVSFHTAKKTLARLVRPLVA